QGMDCSATRTALLENIAASPILSGLLSTLCIRIVTGVYGSTGCGALRMGDLFAESMRNLCGTHLELSGPCTKTMTAHSGSARKEARCGTKMARAPITRRKTGWQVMIRKSLSEIRRAESGWAVMAV